MAISPAQAYEATPAPSNPANQSYAFQLGPKHSLLMLVEHLQQSLAWHEQRVAAHGLAPLSSEPEVHLLLSDLRARIKALDAIARAK